MAGEEERIRVESQVIVVNERPYSVWHPDLRRSSRDFLQGLAPGYFEDIAEMLRPELEGDRGAAAAANIRLAFSHGVETLLALLFAALQAPFAPAAWLLLYRPGDIGKMVSKVEHGDHIPHKLDLDEPFSWLSMARFFLGPPEGREEVVERWAQWYGDLWSWLARDCMSSAAIAEYNSIKHGLRITPGGHTLAVGGRLLAQGRHGSKFLLAERIGADRVHVTLRHCWRNWDADGLCTALKNITLSLRNIIAVLEFVNSTDGASQLELHFPDDPTDSSAPWRDPKLLGSTSFSELTLDEGSLPALDRDAMLSHYNDPSQRLSWRGRAE